MGNYKGVTSCPYQVKMVAGAGGKAQPARVERAGGGDSTTEEMLIVDERYRCCGTKEKIVPDADVPICEFCKKPMKKARQMHKITYPAVWVDTQVEDLKKDVEDNGIETIRMIF